MANDLAALLGVRLPLIQAPMAGSSGVRLAVAASEAGALGSLPCAMLSPEQIGDHAAAFRAATRGPLHVNFFAHEPPTPDAARDEAWLARVAANYREFGLPLQPSGASRAPFDDTLCGLVEELRPEIVSFHFGLPAPKLVARVRAAGAKVLSSATTPDEARWLEARGCDAIIAQGAEAGGHRGLFLTKDIATQIGLFALLPLVVDAVRVPVIAAGGIADRRGVKAAFELGASAVQPGTAFLRCPECDTSQIHRAALAAGGDTALTNILTGRPARGLINRFMREHGPMNAQAPSFPGASGFLGPLRAAAEAKGSGDFSPLWAGQAVALAQEKPAAAVIAELMG